MRTASVRMPRIALSASYGEGVEPCSTEYAQIASISSCSPAITPSVASLRPAIPFVAECSERWTPWASGCWPSGVAKVESTTVIGPRSEPSSSRSTSSRRGLDGVSASTSIVRPGRTAAANAPGSVAVDQRGLDAHSLARTLQERERAGVELALGDDVVAGGAQREHRRGDCAHSRRECEGVVAAFQHGDGLLEGSHRGVGVSAVELPGADGGRPPVGVDEPVGFPHRAGPQRGRERRAAVSAPGGDGPRGGLLALAHRTNATWYGTPVPTELSAPFELALYPAAAFGVWRPASGALR